MGRWNDHENNDPTHLQNVRRTKMVATLKLKKKSKTEKLSSLEEDALKQNTRNQVSLNQFFAKKKSTTSSASVASASAALPATMANESELPQSQPSKMKGISCEGILAGFAKTDMQPYLAAYVLYASIADNSIYRAGYVGQLRLAQIYHRECNGKFGSKRKTTQGTHYSCDDCDNVRYVDYDCF